MTPRCAGRQHPKRFSPPRAFALCWLGAPQHRDGFQEQEPPVSLPHHTEPGPLPPLQSQGCELAAQHCSGSSAPARALHPGDPRPHVPNLLRCPPRHSGDSRCHLGGVGGPPCCWLGARGGCDSLELWDTRLACHHGHQAGDGSAHRGRMGWQQLGSWHGEGKALREVQRELAFRCLKRRSRARTAFSALLQERRAQQLEVAQPPAEGCIFKLMACLNLFLAEL